MVTIDIPEGLKLPNKPQFDLPVSFTVQDGKLAITAISGIALPEAEPESEGEEEAATPEQEPSFTSAVEAAMAKNKGGQPMM